MVLFNVFILFIYIKGEKDNGIYKEWLIDICMCDEFWLIWFKYIN